MQFLSVPHLAPFVLTDAATVATDASRSNHFRVTLTANRTLGAPTNPTDGQRCVWEFIQDGGGTNTITLTTSAGGFNLGDDITAVTLSTAGDARDYMTAIYNSTADRWDVVGFVKGF